MFTYRYIISPFLLISLSNQSFLRSLRRISRFLFYLNEPFPVEPISSFSPHLSFHLCPHHHRIPPPSSQFSELRTEMAAKMRDEEDRLLKRHADIMARLMAERERKLWRMRQTWSAGAQVSIYIVALFFRAPMRDFACGFFIGFFESDLCCCCRRLCLHSRPVLNLKYVDSAHLISKFSHRFHQFILF